MRGFRQTFGASFWTANLMLLASAVFLNRFGQALFGGARINFFVDTLGLNGGQVLWLEGIREVPGLCLMFVAALMMRLPLSSRGAVSVLIMGISYTLYAFVHSYTALLTVVVVASMGEHMWMPLHSALAMSLSSKENTGRVLGVLTSVGALASLVGMGALSVVSRYLDMLPLNTYYIAGGVVVIVASSLIYRLPRDIGATETKQPRLVLKRRYWLYYVLTFFQGSRKQVLNTLGTLFLVEKFGLKIGDISLLLLVSTVVNMSSGPYMGHLIDRFGERRMVPLSYVLLAFCCVGFATAGSVWMLMGLLVITKLFVLLGMGLSTYVYRIAPPEELTPTLSAGISINHVSSVAMPLLAGSLLSLVGYEGIFLGTAGLILLSVPFAMALSIETASVAETDAPHESRAVVP